ncbi:MAG: hypothetical protein M1832_003941 [Thelocarpon impressellum]|nr:MAG: hypothetical protein M1832_003941 [Thelocarpon impressellum]
MSGAPCKDCVSGHVNPGTPAGAVSKLYGVDTYISAPPPGNPAKGLIVIVPDAFGWDFVNSRVLADAFAKQGDFLVYLPDFMNSGAMSSSVLGTMNRLMGPAGGMGGSLVKPVLLVQVLSNFLPFLYRNRAAVVGPRINAFFREIRKHETLAVGVAGYCWGGQHAILLAHDDAETKAPLVDAVFTAHPSGVDIPGHIRGVRVPLSIAIGTKDMVLNMKGVHELQTTLGEKTDVPNEVQTYEGAKHGFAVRGNPKDPDEAAQASRAEAQAVAWFSEHLKKGPTEPVVITT